MKLFPTSKAIDRVRLTKFLVVLMMILGLGLQILNLYYNANRRTITGSVAIRLDPNLYITDVVDVAAAEAGFQQGDQIIKLNNHAVATALDYRTAIQDHEVDSLVMITVRRDGQAIQLSPIRVKNVSLNPSVISRNLLAFAFFVIAALVVLQRPQNKAALLFSVVGFFLGLYFALSGARIHAFIYLWIITLAITPSITIHFFLVFPTERRLSRSPWWLSLYTPGLILTVLTVLAYQKAVESGYGIYYAPHYATFSSIVGPGYLAFGALFGVVSIGYVYFTTEKVSTKLQLKWAIWGLVSTTLMAAIYVAISRIQVPEMVEMQSVQSNGVIFLQAALIPILIAFAFAVVRYRLLDVELVISQSVVYGLLTALLAALYLLLIGVLSYALSDAVGSASRQLLIFISALFIGFLINPLRGKVQSFIDRLFFRQQIEYQQALIQWSQALSTSLHLDDLASLLLQDVPEALAVSHAWLLVQDESNSVFEPWPIEITRHHAKLTDGAEPLTSIGASAVNSGEAKRFFMLDDEGEKDVTLVSDEVLAAWEDAGVRIIFPLLSGGDLVGIYLLGTKLSGGYYQRKEIDLLCTLVNQASVAVENARLYTSLAAQKEQLDRAYEALQELDKRKSEFLSTVSHELRTPLTPVKGCIENMLGGIYGPINGKQKARLETALLAVNDESRLVDNLLDLVRIQEGRVSLAMESVSIVDILRNVFNVLEYDAAEKDIDLTLDVPADDDIVAWVDRVKIKQIVTNLVHNAIKFTQQEGQVEISALREDGGIKIRVTDTGIGIAQRDIEKIFDRFYQADSSLTREISGVGIGLNIVKEYVELHGGKVSVESIEGMGTTFTVTLPQQSRSV